MTPATKIRSLRLALATGIFAVSFFCGSLGQRPAQAQLGELGAPGSRDRLPRPGDRRLRNGPPWPKSIFFDSGTLSPRDEG